MLNLEPCIPPHWAKNGHLQTILGHFIHSPNLKTQGKRINIALKDQDQLSCTFFEGTSNWIISIFHGLGGDTSADYMQRTAILALKQNHSVLLVNHRGAGEGQRLARRTYNCACTDDISEIAYFIKTTFPKKKHLAIGFSLSGNALLSLLSSNSDRTSPDSAIVVNAPLHLEKTAMNLSKGLNRIYDIRFVHQWRKALNMRHKSGLLNKRYSFPLHTTLYEFDSLYTAPEGGFVDREHYYASCAVDNRLDQIKIPTIVLTAKDDPITDFADYQNAQFSLTTFFHAENYGGHMGYLSLKKTPLGSFRWQDYAIHEAILALNSAS